MAGGQKLLPTRSDHWTTAGATDSHWEDGAIQMARSIIGHTQLQKALGEILAAVRRRSCAGTGGQQCPSALLAYRGAMRRYAHQELSGKPLPKNKSQPD